MKEDIEKLNDLKNQTTSKLKDWVRNKSIPLDERWSLFFQSDLGNHIGSIEDFVNLNDDDIADRMQRYEIVHLNSIGGWGIKTLNSKKNYDEFREDVLNKFIKSFEWDW